MNVEEIFTRISAHMIEGMMKHEQLADYYDFLYLDGFCCSHKYRYLCETYNRSKIHNFYINQYNKLIPDTAVNAVNFIPATWYKATRMDVDPTTKKTAVKTGFTEWHNWEKSTVKAYTDMHKILVELGENAAAEMIEWLIGESEKEIKFAEKMIIYLNAIGYDLAEIYSIQNEIEQTYSQKMHCLAEKI